MFDLEYIEEAEKLADLIVHSLTRGSFFGGVERIVREDVKKSQVEGFISYIFDEIDEENFHYISFRAKIQRERFGRCKSKKEREETLKDSENEIKRLKEELKGVVEYAIKRATKTKEEIEEEAKMLYERDGF